MSTCRALRAGRHVYKHAQLATGLRTSVMSICSAMPSIALQVRCGVESVVVPPSTPDQVIVKLSRGEYTFSAASIARSPLLRGCTECAPCGRRPYLPFKRRQVQLWDELKWDDVPAASGQVSECLAPKDLLSVVAVRARP